MGEEVQGAEDEYNNAVGEALGGKMAEEIQAEAGEVADYDFDFLDQGSVSAWLPAAAEPVRPASRRPPKTVLPKSAAGSLPAKAARSGRCPRRRPYSSPRLNSSCSVTSTIRR